MKKLLKLLSTISMVSLTLTLLRSSTSWIIIITLLVSLFSFGWLIYKYDFIERIKKLPNVFNPKLEYVLSLILTYFTTNHLLGLLTSNVFSYRIINGVIDNLSEKLYYMRRLIYYIEVHSGLNIKLSSIVLGLVISLSIFFLSLYLIRKLTPIVVNFFKNMTRLEEAYFIIASIVMVFILFLVYMNTSVFSTPTHKEGYTQNYDVVFTTDNGAQIYEDTYKNIFAPENDLRQPLFGLFSYPFGIASEIVAKVFYFVDYTWMYSFMIALFQVLCLNVVVILLARMLNKTTKLIPMLLFSTTYTYLLFAINLEQYVFGMFWLISLIYIYVKNKSSNPYLFSAATGSLLTNGILLPFLAKKEKSIDTFKEMIKYLLIFGLIIVLVGKFADFYNGILGAEKFKMFMGGEKVGLLNQFQQFTHFIVNMFVAPETTVIISPWGLPSYQLAEINNFNIIGILIFIVSIIGFYINREKLIAKIAFGWVLYSVLILGIIGWGTPENGLILYSLYFIWAYFILLYLFVDKVLEKQPIIKKGFFIIIITFFIVVNFFGFTDLLGFGFEIYPR